MHPLKELAASSPAWPFAEARSLVKRYAEKAPEKGYVLFETGYGPSGLPHIGTFAEVARTLMVLNAFRILSDLPTRLICYSDDMDGLRKVPDNIPQQERIAQHLGKPLTQVPDPFGEYPSFAHHNNARLRAFLDGFGFEYEFYSSTECYRSGRFDEALLAVLRHHEDIRRVVLPTLGPERQATYSPFLPLCPSTGEVLQVPILETDAAAGTITFDDATGERQTVEVTGGRVKCQWKVDWAMRWHALAVDYEMSGKDLLESVILSSKITRVLGSRPPETYTYELFLDEKGEKISKSKGNGLTIDEWLAYATPESLSLFLYRKPRKAKRLHSGVIPRTMDEYQQHQEGFAKLPPEKQINDPLFHIHSGDVPTESFGLSYSVLLNLASVAHVRETDELWQFVRRYLPDSPKHPSEETERLLKRAVRYYADFVEPNLKLRTPSELEAEAFGELAKGLRSLDPEASAEDIQTVVYEVGKAYPFESLRHWFQALYECLIGQSAGPRMGTFFKVFGLENSIDLIESKI
ncbi:MAG: lysine--tRNA ligase [Acidobacteriota bacterium]